MAACFVAIFVHSLGYADFTVDPATWALLGLGVALRRTEPVAGPRRSPVARPARRPRPATRSSSGRRLRVGPLGVAQRMFEYLRRLATTGAAYTASSVFSKLIAVFLLPIYTHYLTPSDYGAAEVMLSSVIAASIVVRFGIIEAILRFYYLRGGAPGAGGGDRLRRPVLGRDDRRRDRAAARRADLARRCCATRTPGWRASRSSACGR